jgi:hypothetical protein
MALPSVHNTRWVIRGLADFESFFPILQILTLDPNKGIRCELIKREESLSGAGERVELLTMAEPRGPSGDALGAVQRWR